MSEDNLSTADLTFIKILILSSNIKKINHKVLKMGRERGHASKISNIQMHIYNLVTPIIGVARSVRGELLVAYLLAVRAGVRVVLEMLPVDVVAQLYLVAETFAAVAAHVPTSEEIKHKDN